MDLPVASLKIVWANQGKQIRGDGKLCENFWEFGVSKWTFDNKSECGKKKRRKVKKDEEEEEKKLSKTKT